MTGKRLSALEFARLLRARQEREEQAAPYLTELQAAIRTALEERGYQEISVRPLVDASLQPDVAAQATVVILARLPLEGLKTPIFKVQLPLVVTYAGELVVRGAQINRFTVDETFVQPVSAGAADVADGLVQFLSERYMEHLLRAGPPPAQDQPPSG